jgi:ectoine hydroxylase-related dioxygenase (phytanoyl-CoA dioxygenase family)
MPFRNKKSEQLFNLNGYIVIPFLDSAEVKALRTVFLETHPDIPDGFYSTSFHADEKQKQHINEKIEAALAGIVSRHFEKITKLGSCFLNKQPGVQSEMPIHQDWTVVEEPAFDSITIWIPLQDVDESNGAMQVLEGSHRFSGSLRSPTLENPFKNVQPEVRQDLKLLPMKAGEALIFSHALLHASPPNMSAQPRIAVTYGLIDARAQLQFYHKDEEGKVEQYYVDEKFFQQYNTQIGQRPASGSLQKTFDYTQHFIEPAEYRQKQHQFLYKKSAAMFKMIPIFQEESKQSFFEKEGYAVFPLLNEAEVSALKTYYGSLPIKDEKGFGFHVSMDNSDKDLCREIREKVWGIALPRLGEHLKDFKPFVASYVVKEVNPKGVVPVHQDWSFVDHEDEGFSSITCWIALVDTNLDNGAMAVIRGSHKFMQNRRPSPSPQCPVPLSEHMFSIFPYLQTIDMKAGDVLMFDNRTFHGSPPNTSGAVRLAAGVGVTQKDAQLIHYYLKPDGHLNTMLRYNIDEDFFLKYENATLAKIYDEKQVIEGYGSAAEVPYEFTKYTSDELVELIKSTGNTFNIPMTEKLAKLFGYTGNEPKKEEVTEKKEIEKPVQPEPARQEYKWVDDRSFLQKYTPINIAREIKKRLAGVS